METIYFLSFQKKLKLFSEKKLVVMVTVVMETIYFLSFQKKLKLFSEKIGSYGNGRHGNHIYHKVFKKIL